MAKHKTTPPQRKREDGKAKQEKHGVLADANVEPPASDSDRQREHLNKHGWEPLQTWRAYGL